MVNFNPQSGLSYPQFPLGRMMAFVDGENLVQRYQSMLKDGRKPQLHTVHLPDVYVWTSNSVIQPGLNWIVRSTYYASAVGDTDRILQLHQEVATLRSGQYDSPATIHLEELAGNKFYPKILPKIRKESKSKGLDIQMTIDILSNAYKNNFDAVFLVSGDGDYVPLIEDVMRQGKTVHVAALSSGLNPKLKIVPDKFFDLDGHFFE